MILCYLQNIETAENLLLSASQLSKDLDKDFGVLSYADFNAIKSQKKEFQTRLDQLNIQTLLLAIENGKLSELTDFCETNEVSFLFLQLCNEKSKSIQKLLNACRELRIPYVIFKDSFGELQLERVILPVNFLEEEVEKAQFAAAFGRFCKSEIIMLQANDYGTKAATNTERMKELFDKFNNFPVSILKAEKDSFKVDAEAAQYAKKVDAGLIIITASRDYGLDDVIFGPKERKIIMNSPNPILLVNPRGDLYALCD